MIIPVFNKACANVGLAEFFEVKGERRKVKGYKSSEMGIKRVTGWQKSYKFIL